MRMKLYLFRSILIALICFSGSFSQVFASHVAGADINYVCIGQDSAGNDSIIITVNFFRDCSGIPAPTSPSIDIVNPCGFQNISTNLTLLNPGGTEISQLCAADIPNSTCNGGTLPGIEQYFYVDTVVLAPCDSWTFEFSVSARNPSSNLVGTGLFWVEATLNNDTSQTSGCNNSPLFNAQPIPYVCAFQQVNYDFGVTEPDGDSLVYSLVTALSNGGNAANYAGGFTAQQPIPGIVLDPVTGALTFTPTATGNFVVAVQIDEYDQNGVLVGSIVRDIQFVVQNCSNNVPQAAPGGISNFTGTGQQLDSNSVVVCLGENFCFDIEITDSDTANSLILTSNVGTVLPGATFSVTGTNPAIATICWNAIPVPGSFSTFNIFAEDDACPINGISNTTLDITIVGTTFLGPDVTICVGDSTQLNAQGGSVFTWSSISGSPIMIDTNFSCDSCGTPWVKPDTTTTYVVVSDLNGVCQNTDTITVFVTNAFDLTIDSAGPYCSNGVEDILTSVTPGGVWSGLGITDAVQGIFDPSVAGPGTHTITYFFPGSCGGTVTRDITVIPAPDATILSTGPFCALDTLLTLVAATPGGVWTGTNILDSALGTFNPNALGLGNFDTLTYTVTDSICTTSDTAIVTTDTLFDATIDTNQTGPFCINDTIVVLTAADPGGSWFGTGITDSLLGTFDPSVAGPGTFTISYIFSGSCSDTDSVSITVFGLPNTSITLGQTLFCDDNTSTITITETQPGGIWSGSGITNPASGTFVPATLGAGFYEAIYTIDPDANGCGNSDTVTFVVTPSPAAPTVFTNSPYCSGDLLSGIFATGDTLANMFWFSDSALTDTVATGNTLTPTVATTSFTYYVIQVLGDCVSPPTPVTVLVSPSPTIDFTATPTFGGPPLVVQFTNLSTPNNISYLWDFGDNSTSTDVSPSHTYSQNGVYEAVLTNIDTLGCLDTHRIVITVSDSVAFTIPNVFSPNRDGVNDLFEIGIENATEFSVAIFNRWGNKVYEWKNFPHGWDGEFANDGVYFYVIEAKGFDGKIYQRHGHFTLIRSANR